MISAEKLKFFFKRMNFFNLKFAEVAFKTTLCFVLKFICIMTGEICFKALEAIPILCMMFQFSHFSLSE